MNATIGWFIGFFFALLVGLEAGAQPAADAQKRYKAAVKLVQTGDYERAKTDLNTIIQRGGSLAPYAHYYYALAVFRQKNFNQARLMLKQLMYRFPDWRRMDDAQYLLGAVCMETGQYEDGLTALQSIGDQRYRPDIQRMEQMFIGRITDLNRLRQMNREFPDNRSVGLALIDLIQRTGTDRADLELSDRLTNRFGVPMPGSSVSPSASGTVATATSTTQTAPFPAAPRSGRPKGYYNVAIMFPFRLGDFESAKRNRTNQYAYDLYNGIKMAKVRLQEEGITVNLFAYDLDNDPNKALELVNSPAFAQTDLIIGPLYLEPNRIASAYASQKNIVLLNPIATSSDLIANQPTAFLAQASLTQQAEKAAAQAQALGGRRAAVYYGDTRKDSLLALAYQQALKARNFQIVDARKLGTSAQVTADAMRLGDSPTTATAGVTLGHVFLASSNPDDGPRLLEALSRRRVSAPLIASATAFDFYRDAASTFTRRDLYLIDPEYMDASREPVIGFREQYLAKRNTIPSIFAAQGYDMMLFFGRQLAKNGQAFRDRSALHSDSDDYLLSGFDYTQSNENQIAPIVKYDGGRFVKVN